MLGRLARVTVRVRVRVRVRASASARVRVRDRARAKARASVRARVRARARVGELGILLVDVPLDEAARGVADGESVRRHELRLGDR